MRINITSVLVDDQAKALDFYTEVLGFVKKTDLPTGDSRWLTVVSPEAPDGVELLLEPDSHPAAGPTFSATAVVKAITSCCVVRSISSMRAMSKVPFWRSSRAASTGTIPAAAIASAAASSTCNQVS